MNKVYRFMEEYKAYQLRYLDACSMMNPGIREELKRRLEKAVESYKRGYITVDECMRLLSLPDSGEDMSEYRTEA